jgi:hypothetical protein
MGQEGRGRGVGLPPLLAHAARTIGMCSLDVRSEAEAAQPLWVEEGALGKGRVLARLGSAGGVGAQ